MDDAIGGTDMMVLLLVLDYGIWFCSILVYAGWATPTQSRHPTRDFSLRMTRYEGPES